MAARKKSVLRHSYIKSATGGREEQSARAKRRWTRGLETPAATNESSTKAEAAAHQGVVEVQVDGAHAEGQERLRRTNVEHAAKMQSDRRP